MVVIPITFTNFQKGIYNSDTLASTDIRADIAQLQPYYAETSNGKVSLGTITVTNRVTLPYDVTGCLVFDPNQGSVPLPYALPMLATEAMAKAGVAEGSYERLLFVLPGIQCSGYAQNTYYDDPYYRAVAFPDTSNAKRAWVNGFTLDPGVNGGDGRFSATRKLLNPKAIVQALGFTMGLKWAYSDGCKCGDQIDAMGNTSFNKPLIHFNAASKDKLGWLNTGDITDLIAGMSQSVRIKATSLNQTMFNPQPPNNVLPKVLRISLPSQSAYCYLDYRAPFGFDNNTFYSETNSVQGVSIHKVDSAGSIVMVDATPQGIANTALYPSLGMMSGQVQTFSDSTNNLRVTVQPYTDVDTSYTGNTETTSVLIKVEPIVATTIPPTLTPTKTPAPLPATPTPVPLTMVRQSFLSNDGKTYYQRICPFDTVSGAPSSSCTIAYTPVSVAGIGMPSSVPTTIDAYVNFIIKIIQEH